MVVMVVIESTHGVVTSIVAYWTPTEGFVRKTNQALKWYMLCSDTVCSNRKLNMYVLHWRRIVLCVQ
jgi:hypothetical protein